jgi:hydrogenase maturation protease
MGNPILSDDAIGVRLARDVRRALRDRRDVDVTEECSVGGLNLLDYLVGFTRAVVIDAVRSGGKEPGQCYHFTADSLRQTVNLCNVHDTNFATALLLGRHLGCRLPDDQDIHIFGVEIVDDRTFGIGLTPAVARCYPHIRRCLMRMLQTLIGAPSGC